MIRDLGWVHPCETLYIPFHTFDSNDPSASVTISGLATTDIEVYKDGSTTQRASDSGYALLDTDGIDFDSTTGIHGVSIDLSDNTTAGFWAAGSQYWVVIASITVDAATINFLPVTFRIGLPDALLNTTINTYTSTDNFTLNAGSADDDAYNGCRAIAYDVATQHQVQVGVVEDYTGLTKTVNLLADPGIFTMTANDNICILPPITAGAVERNAFADALLDRDMSLVTVNNTRSPINAFRFIRNKWSISGTTLTVTEEDDTTSAWTATVTTDAAADPITGNDPA